MPAIFISYRRSDTAAYAGRLHDRLAAHFGSSAVFLDTDDITPGAEFVRVIEARIATCSAFLTVIGEGWLSDADGRRRLEKYDDPVRREIESAIQHRVPIIPIVVGSAAMPESRELPESIRCLAERSALRVTHEMFDESVEKLIKTLSPRGYSSLSAPRPVVLRTTLPALFGTAATVLFFNSSSITQSVPIGPAETVVIFVCWLFVSGTTGWVVRKMLKGSRPE
jgi:hypothetical protein